MLSQNATRVAISIADPIKIDHVTTRERKTFRKPPEGLDSWPRGELLEMEIRTSLALGIVEFNDANSCFLAMASSSVVDTDSARGFVASIAGVCTVLDEVSMELLSYLMSLTGTNGLSRVAILSATAVASPMMTEAVSLICFGLDLFLTFLGRAMA